MSPMHCRRRQCLVRASPMHRRYIGDAALFSASKRPLAAVVGKECCPSQVSLFWPNCEAFFFAGSV
eukprot:9479404-Pyramimonas_sp.AAC.1